MYFITTKATKGQQFRILGTQAKRDAARDAAKNLNGTVRTHEEMVALVDAGSVDNRDATKHGFVKAESISVADPKLADQPEAKANAATWADIAKNINSTAKVRKTLGKKEKTPRPVTPESVLAEAVTFIDSVAAGSKVDVVRQLAAWTSSDGVQLQRKDAIKLLNEHVASISTATISTQWQLVRSGKFVAKAAE